MSIEYFHKYASEGYTNAVAVFCQRKIDQLPFGNVIAMLFCSTHNFSEEGRRRKSEKSEKNICEFIYD